MENDSHIDRERRQPPPAPHDSSKDESYDDFLSALWSGADFPAEEEVKEDKGGGFAKQLRFLGTVGARDIPNGSPSNADDGDPEDGLFSLSRLMSTDSQSGDFCRSSLQRVGEHCLQRICKYVEFTDLIHLMSCNRYMYHFVHHLSVDTFKTKKFLLWNGKHKYEWDLVSHWSRHGVVWQVRETDALAPILAMPESRTKSEILSALRIGWTGKRSLLESLIGPMFAKMHSLYLASTYLTLHGEPLDVSALGRLHTLDLACLQVQGIAALSHVHTLNLSKTNVTDVSSLVHVHTLSLAETKVSDVSSLAYCHTLNLSHCFLVKDVSALGNVHSLSLIGTAVADVSALRFVHTLDLTRCKKVRDVSALSEVVNLNLACCHKITGLAFLLSVQRLDLSFATLAEELPSFPNITHLILDSTTMPDTAHPIKCPFDFISHMHTDDDKAKGDADDIVQVSAEDLVGEERVVKAGGITCRLSPGQSIRDYIPLEVPFKPALQSFSSCKFGHEHPELYRPTSALEVSHVDMTSYFKLNVENFNYVSLSRLTLPRHLNLTAVQTCIIKVCKRLPALSQLQHVHTLVLTETKLPEDISPLKNVHTLSILGSHDVQLDPLADGNVHVLRVRTGVMTKVFQRTHTMVLDTVALKSFHCLKNVVEMELKRITIKPNL